jgi:hypothetical protein
MTRIKTLIQFAVSRSLGETIFYVNDEVVEVFDASTPLDIVEANIEAGFYFYVSEPER